MSSEGQRLRDLTPEQRRSLEPGPRARALLELGAERISWMSKRPAPATEEKIAKYNEFHRCIEIVQLLAEGRAFYDQGISLGQVVTTDDPRLAAIASLAELVAVPTEQLDRRTLELLADSENGLALAEAFMAGLPRSSNRASFDPPSSRSLTRAERAQAWSAVFEQDGARAWELIGAMPEAIRSKDRAAWEQALLAPTDYDQPLPEEMPDPEPIRPEVLLRASALVYRSVREKIKMAEAEKASRLSQFRTSLQGEDAGVAFSARERDLHAELVEPLAAELEHVGRLVVRAAVGVRSVASWPGQGARVVRALKLAAMFRQVDREELRTALASLGYAKLGAKDAD